MASYIVTSLKPLKPYPFISRHYFIYIKYIAHYLATLSPHSLVLPLFYSLYSSLYFVRNKRTSILFCFVFVFLSLARRLRGLI